MSAVSNLYHAHLIDFCSICRVFLQPGHLCNLLELSGYKGSEQVQLMSQLRALSLPSMRSVILSAVGFCATVLAQSSIVDQYVATELPIAQAGLLANIGPSGSQSSGAAVCYITDNLITY